MKTEYSPESNESYLNIIELFGDERGRAIAVDSSCWLNEFNWNECTQIKMIRTISNAISRLAFKQVRAACGVRVTCH